MRNTFHGVETWPDTSAAGEAPARMKFPYGRLGQAELHRPLNPDRISRYRSQVGFGEHNLRISVQIGRRAFEEATLLQVAHLLENWHPD